jgi:hypothetical protein
VSLRPLPPAAQTPVYDRVVIADYTSRLVIEEVVQLLGFDPGDVLSISVTADEVAVITRDRDALGRRTWTRTLHRSVIR